MVLVFLNCLVVPKRSFLSEFGVGVPARQMATAEPTAQAAAHAAEAQAALEAVGEVLKKAEGGAAAVAAAGAAAASCAKFLCFIMKHFSVSTQQRP